VGHKELIKAKMDQTLIGETVAIAAVHQCAFSSIDKLLPLPQQAPENKHGK